MIFDALFGDPGGRRRTSPTRAASPPCCASRSRSRRPEAATGVIPERAVDAIAQSADVADYDLDVLAREAVNAGNLAIPLVQRLTEHVGRVDEDSARYVHWGATSQDIIDTAMVLQLRDATAIVLRIARARERRGRRAGGAARRDGDAGAHLAATRHADHLRAQGRRVDERPRSRARAPRRCARALDGPPARRRIRHARRARRSRTGCRRDDGRGAPPRRARASLARAPRSPRDARMRARRRHGHDGEDRARRRRCSRRRRSPRRSSPRRGVAADRRRCRRSETR